MSFGEIFNDAKPSDEQFLDYVRYGGMPGRFQFDDSRTAKNYIMDMYHSILLRDIVKRYRIRDVDLLQRFMVYLIHNVGQIFSAERLQNI